MAAPLEDANTLKMPIAVLVALVMASTVGVYAASVTLNPLALGGTGSMEINAPSSGSIQIAWTLTGVQVDGANVTWTPSSTATFDIDVEVGGSEGSKLDVAGVSGISQTAFVAISPALGPKDLSSFEVVILEN